MPPPMMLSAFCTSPTNMHENAAQAPFKVNTYTEQRRPMHLLCQPSSSSVGRSSVSPERQQFLLAPPPPLATSGSSCCVRMNLEDTVEECDGDEPLPPPAPSLHRAVTMSSSTSSDRHRRRRPTVTPGQRRRYIDNHVWASADACFATPAAPYGIDRKTVHTLYAGSFLVYLINVTGDWVHTVYACRGLTVTFPLDAWCVVVMVVSCVLGSTLNFLSIHLCLENALRRPKRFQRPVRTCWRQLCTLFKRWLTSFDCFRISFLIMLLQDVPMTVINFWWLGGCMTANPRQSFLPAVFGPLSTVLSLAWRMVMLFYASVQWYRIFQVATSRGKSDATGDHLTAVFVGSNDNSGTTSTTIGTAGSAATAATESKEHMANNQATFQGLAAETGQEEQDELDRPALSQRLSHWLATGCRGALFCLLYTASMMVGCLPCAHQFYYKNVNQERYDKTLRRVAATCSMVHQAVLLLLSVAIVLLLFTLNVVWLHSAFLLGKDGHTVEHVSRVCLRIDADRKEVQLALAGADWPQAPWLCKPLFEAERTTLGPEHQPPARRWQLRQPAAWVLVQRWPAVGQTTSLWTDVQVADRADQPTVIWFDMLAKNGTSCGHLEEMGWSMVSRLDAKKGGRLWLACQCTYSVRRLAKLSCES